MQTLSSSQSSGGPPAQVPSAQVSSVVQASPSSHDAVLFVCTHPVAGSHESSVQTLPSSQSGGGPPMHTPAEQVSAVVQALPSSHDAVLFVWTHPVAGSHESSVQALPSVQSGGGPPTQVPPAQASGVVHGFPSSQDAVLFMCTHPVAELHESFVQTSPSSQSGGAPPTHAPAEQVSPVVQASPSSQDAVLSTCMQPVAGSQESSVQTFPSLQFGGGPPTHAPAAQVSAVVQASPSSQAAALFACTQPVAGSHESLVQTSPSLQSGGAPPRHAPAEQVSLVVQALSSSQGAVLLACTHPATGLQESSVQTSPSSQSGGAPPRHAPPEQVSPVVQASPSSQDAALSACTQPVAGSQESSVQTLPSSQSGGGPPRQMPPEHVSPAVQGSPSSQGAALLVFTQPVTGSQESSVQMFLSPHTSGVPFVHSFSTHCSIPSHTSLLSQSDSLSQQPGTGGPGVHTPPTHVSSPLQKTPSGQDVPSGAMLS